MYNIPPKRMNTKEPTTAKIMAETTTTTSHPLHNSTNVAKVTISINRYIDTNAYKIDLVKKGLALLFQCALPDTFFEKLTINIQQLLRVKQKKIVVHHNLTSSISTTSLK
jgi:hypothetical protein